MGQDSDSQHEAQAELHEIRSMTEAPHLSPEQQRRVGLMLNIAQQITADAGDKLVLKGGTALLLAYRLPRYSTDLDFDGKRKVPTLDDTITQGAILADVEITSLTKKKDTDTTTRYMLHYSGVKQPDPLKIEVSYRQANEIDERDVIVVNGFRVYKIERLAHLTIGAFLDRLAGRDIFDTRFLLEHYPEAVTDDHLDAIAAIVQEIGEDGLLDIVTDDELLQCLRRGSHCAFVGGECEQTSQRAWP